MLFKVKFIISSYPQQFFFIRTGYNFAVNIKSNGHYIFDSKNHKLKFTRISLHRINFKQINAFIRSCLRLENKCSRYLWQLYSALSSEKLQTSDFVMEENKSFMKILKRRGPRIDSCGTPVLISHHELKGEPIFLLCFRLIR